MKLFILISNFALASHTGMGMGKGMGHHTQPLCSSITCVYQCNGNCGWSSLFNSCLYGFHTSQNELNNGYGCSTTSTINSISSTIPSTTSTISSISSTIPSTTSTISSISSTIPSTTSTTGITNNFLNTTISAILTIHENNPSNISNYNKHSLNTNTNNSNLVITLSITGSIIVSIFILFLFLKRKNTLFHEIENENVNKNNESNEDNEIIINNKDSNLYLEPTPLVRQNHVFNNAAYSKNDI